MNNRTKLIVLNIGLIAVIVGALFAMFKYPNFEKAINLEVVDRTDRGFIARTSIPSKSISLCFSIAVSWLPSPIYAMCGAYFASLVAMSSTNVPK